jgi:hypothetical protein
MKKSIARTYLVVGLALLLVGAVFTSASLGQEVSSTGSRLVVLADDWTLGNYFGYGDEALFAGQVFNWLTEYASPDVRDKILIDEAYVDPSQSGHDLSGLISTLEGLGFTVDSIHPQDWTPEVLAGYGAVLLERGQPVGGGGGDIVKSYILGGGGAIIVGGGLPENLDNHNNIINPFGLNVNSWTSIQPPLNAYELSIFVPHFITEGVSSLWTVNPTPIVLAPDKLEFKRGPSILCTQQPDGYDEIHWLAVWELIKVTVDIKPGSDPNCINSDGHGVIPVAILSDFNFDAAQVDPSTLSLDGQAVRVAGKANMQAHLEDVNGDGLDDLVVQIEDVDGSYQQGASMATLTGKTYDGVPIEGTDSICIVP